MNIAFLGAGQMGSGMISCLLRGEHQVTVYNRTPEKLVELVRQGARSSPSPAAAAKDAEVVFSMVMNDEASRQVWLGPEGALHGPVKPEAILVECSTLSHRWVLEFHDACAARGFASLDCPVAGRPSAAAAGTLNVFAGGPAEVIDKVRPLLGAFARSIVRFGPVGSGIAFKLIYNMLGAIQLASLAEAMVACDALNIDLSAAADAFSTGSTGSTHVRHHGALMASGEHVDPAPFTGEGRLKDLTYAIELLDRFHINAVIAAAAAHLYRSMIEAGDGRRSDTELFETLRDELNKRLH